MKSTLSIVVAALFAAGAASLAQAQPATGQQGSTVANPPEGTTALSDANVPTNTPDPNSAAASLSGEKPAPGLALPFVNEPAASTYVKEGDDADLANRVVQALNADPSLKNSKITVQPEKGNVLLTGSVATTEQARLATALANGQVGNGTVVNAIQPDQIAYKSPQLEMENASILESEPQQAQSEEQAQSGEQAQSSEQTQSGEPPQQPAMQTQGAQQQS
jgi:hypothetical protein